MSDELHQNEVRDRHQQRDLLKEIRDLLKEILAELEGQLAAIRGVRADTGKENAG